MMSGLSGFCGGPVSPALRPMPGVQRRQLFDFPIRALYIKHLQTYNTAGQPLSFCCSQSSAIIWSWIHRSPALAILGLKFDNVGLILGGSVLPKPTGVLVRTVNDTSAMHYTGERGSLNLTEKDLARAAQMAENLVALSSRKSIPRLLKGVRSFVAGLESRHGAERLHGFVRSLDGVTKLPPGKGTKEFVRRCQV